MGRPDADPDVTSEQADAPPETNHAAPAEAGPDPVAHLEDRLLRTRADLDNMRKRCERQIAQARTDERARVAAAWLPIVDNLERALTHADAEPGAVIDGIRAVRDQAVAVLGSLGFARHDEANVPFDPQLHEAISVMPHGDAPAGTVVTVLRPGYGEGNRQIRPAAVIVAGEPE